MTLRKRTLGQLIVVGVLAGVCLSVANLSSAIVVRHDESSHVSPAQVQYYDQNARDLANRNRYQAVGQLINWSGGQYAGHCTATLIDVPGHENRYLLTAAHCVDTAEELTFRLGPGGNDLEPDMDLFQLEGGDWSRHYEAEAWAVHGGWAGDLFESNDVGLVRLAEPLDVEPMRIRSPRSNSDEIGTDMVHVGYGATGDGQFGDYWSDMRKRAGQNTVVAHSFMNSPAVHLMTRFNLHFDDPLYSDPGDPRDEFYDWDLDLPRPNEVSLAPGDSGGPAIHERHNEVIGIHSFVYSPFPQIPTTTYLSYASSVWVEPYYDWIFDTIDVIEEIFGDIDAPEEPDDPFPDPPGEPPDPEDPDDPDDPDNGTGALVRTGIEQQAYAQVGVPGQAITDELLVQAWADENNIDSDRIMAALAHRDYRPYTERIRQADYMHGRQGATIGGGGDGSNAGGAGGGDGGGGNFALPRGGRAGGGGGGGAAGMAERPAPQPQQRAQSQRLLDRADARDLQRQDEQDEQPEIDPAEMEKFERLRELYRYKYRIAETEEEREQIRLEWRRLSIEKDPRLNRSDDDSSDDSDDAN